MEPARRIDLLSQDPAQLLPLFNDPAWGAVRLRDIAIFNRFTDDELTMLYSIGSLVKLNAKANALIEGESTRGMLHLLYGRVGVYKKDPATGELVRLATLEEGANIGEMSLIDGGGTRSSTVVAETTCYLFQAGDRPLWSLFGGCGRRPAGAFFQDLRGGPGRPLSPLERRLPELPAAALEVCLEEGLT